MAAYKGPSRRVKDALVTVLGGIQYDAGSGSEQAMYVSDSSHGAFEGYPGARVLPGDVDDQKASVAENERTVSYLVIVILPMEDQTQSEAATFNKMYDLTDLIMDTLDQGDHDSVLNQVDPAITTYFLNATRGDWYPIEENGGVMWACDMNVQVKYSIQLT